MANFPSICSASLNGGTSGANALKTLMSFSGYEATITNQETALPMDYVIADNHNSAHLTDLWVAPNTEELDITILVQLTNAKSAGGTLDIAIYEDSKKIQLKTVTLPDSGQTIPAYRFQFRVHSTKDKQYAFTYKFSNPPANSYMAPYRTFIAIDSIGCVSAYRIAFGMFESLSNVLPLANTEIITTKDQATNALRVKARTTNKDIVNV